MSVDNRIAFAVMVTWLSRAAVIVLGLLLIPLLFRRLGREEVGLWFLLGQSGAFLGLMDLGVSPTFTRRIAFARAAGATKSAQEAQRELANLIATGRRIYRYLTALVFIVAWIAGLLFLHAIELRQVSRMELWIAWTIMCFSHALGVWASIWSCVLQGTGHVGWDGLVGIAVQVTTLLAQLIAVWLGGGLVALASIAALGALATRWAVYALICKREPAALALKGRWDTQTFKTMVSPALKAWLTGLGAFLILKTDQYFIAYFKSSSQIPDYHAAYQLVSNLMNLSMSVAGASQVFVSQAWRAANMYEVHRIFERSMRFALILMAAGVAYFLTNGRDVISLWLGPQHFIGYPILAVFCVMLFLETQHSAVATASRATEDEVFAVPAILAGCLNLFLTWWLLRAYGLLGIALGTMFAQVLTNNWYVIYRGLNRLRVGYATYFHRVLLPVIASFSAVLVVAALSKALLPTDAGLALKVAATLLPCAAATCLALWIFALDAGERSALAARVRRRHRN